MKMSRYRFELWRICPIYSEGAGGVLLMEQAEIADIDSISMVTYGDRKAPKSKDNWTD